jgi:hypothetical protein
MWVTEKSRTAGHHIRQNDSDCDEQNQPDRLRGSLGLLTRELLDRGYISLVCARRLYSCTRVAMGRQHELRLRIVKGKRHVHMDRTSVAGRPVDIRTHCNDNPHAVVCQEPATSARAHKRRSGTGHFVIHRYHSGVYLYNYSIRLIIFSSWPVLPSIPARQ